jgi:excisionase family DNA binding protein
MTLKPQRAADALSAGQAAELLGIGKNLVYDAAARGEVPHRRLGKRLLFSRQALLDWLACKPLAPERP